MLNSQTSPRHGRTRPGHPRLASSHHGRKTSMAGTKSAFTRVFDALCQAMTTLCLCLLSSITFAEPARAQSVADFYRGKTINLMIGYSVGGGYDLYGRLVS